MTEVFEILSSALAATMTLPLDYRKVCRQVGTSPMSGYRPGYIGWDVCAAKFLGTGSVKLLLFTTIFNYQNTLLSSILLPGAYALLTPLDHILVKLQTQGLISGLKIQGLPEAYRIASSNGLFRGVEACYAKGLVYYAVFAMFRVEKLDQSWHKMLNITFAATAANLVSLPLDFIRVNMQKCGSTADIVKVTTEAYNTLGISGFYKGTGAAVSRSVLSLVICIFLSSMIVTQ